MMKYKFELVLAVLIIPVVLDYVLYGDQFDVEKILRNLMFSMAILLGYVMATKPIQNTSVRLIIIAVFSLSLGVFEATILSNPKDYLIRIIGQSLFTFIGIYWIGRGILKREKKRRKNAKI